MNIQLPNDREPVLRTAYSVLGKLGKRLPLPSLRSAFLASLLTGCTYEGDKYYEGATTVVYETPEAEETSTFVPPEACGITATAETSELPSMPFYGAESDGTQVAILVEEDQLELANRLVNEGGDDFGGGWVEYVPGQDDASTSTEEAVATVCITPLDDSVTVCGQVPFSLVGGMTRTEWHGMGEDEEAQSTEDFRPTIPTMNLDLNQIDPNFKIQDETSGRELDNLRFNPGQYLGLPSAAISYDLAALHGLMHRLNGYVKVTSNVWGIDATSGDCITVPMLNILRDQDGNVCEYNEDGLTGDCSFGVEGYQLADTSGFSCEWAKNGLDDCDMDAFGAFANAVSNAPMGAGFADALAPYVDQEKLIRFIADEKVQGFQDGLSVGNNAVFAATLTPEGSFQFNPEAYSRDYALPAGDYWVDFYWGEPISMGWFNDPATCQTMIDTIRTMNSTMPEDCARIVEEHFDRLERIDALRPGDDGVKVSKLQSCEGFPPAIEAALQEYQATCDAIIAGEFSEEEEGEGEEEVVE